MQKTIADLIAHYGQMVTLVRGEQSEAVWAFFQPVAAKSWQSMERMFGPLGEVPRGQYLYLGPVQPDLLKAEFLRCGGGVYLARRSELLYIGTQALYRWGLCVEGSAAEWNS